MAKLIIRNTLQPEWSALIEARLRFMLGSILTNIQRVEVDFISSNGPAGQNSAYTCMVVVIEHSGERHELHNQQPNPHLAIEGAIARARRAMTRIKRSRSNGWTKALSL